MLKGARAVSCVIMFISIALAFSGISVSVSDLAPDFSIEDIDGNEFTLSDHRGKVVLIDFMKTQCAYCKDLMYDLVVIRENYTEQELVMISISASEYDTVEDMRDYKHTYGGTWTFAKDDQDLVSIYDITAVPTDYIVDVNGCIHSSIRGYRTWDVLTEKINGAKTGCGVPLLPPVEEEKPAYDFTITDIDGSEFQLSEHERSVVLIDFFIPSGLNSALMHGELKAIRDNFTEQELVMISIGVEAKDDQEVRDFKADRGGDWTYARDVEGLWQQFGVNTTPTICIVDVDGRVQFHNVGFTESQELIDNIEEAKVGDQPPPICPECPLVLVAITVVIIAVVLAILAYKWVLKGKKEQ